MGSPTALPNIGYHDAGCRVSLIAQYAEQSPDDAILVSLDVDLSEITLESSVHFAAEVPASIMSEFSQEFTAHVKVGTDTYWWAMAGIDQLIGGRGSVLAYAYRMRFDSNR